MEFVIAHSFCILYLSVGSMLCSRWSNFRALISFTCLDILLVRLFRLQLLVTVLIINGPCSTFGSVEDVPLQDFNSIIHVLTAEQFSLDVDVLIEGLVSEED